MLRRPLVLLLAATALAGAGCGADEEPAQQQPTQPQPAQGTVAVEIAMRNLEFVPASATVKAGESVRWTNEDDAEHDVRNVRDGQQPQSPLFGKGGTHEWTAEGPGRIEYFCSVHPNMTGTLTIR